MEFVMQKQAIGAEGLHALSKIVALEFATKGVRSHFLDISHHCNPGSLSPIFRWIADDRSSFSTGLRIVTN
jgi:hypothetical protein